MDLKNISLLVETCSQSRRCIHYQIYADGRPIYVSVTEYRVCGHANLMLLVLYKHKSGFLSWLAV